MTEDAEDRDSGAQRRDPRKRRRAPRAPRKITRDYLENVALWYLGRFAATARSLEQVLMRRVRRSARHHGSDPDEGAALIAAIITRYREAGLLDDAAFAAARAATLHARGLPVRAIRRKLGEKGVAAADAEAAIRTLGIEQGAGDGTGTDIRALDRAAAWAYARRRRIGPWRDNARRAEMRERDLAALARAGFSYGTAREVIDGDTEDTP